MVARKVFIPLVIFHQIWQLISSPTPKCPQQSLTWAKGPLQSLCSHFSSGSSEGKATPLSARDTHKGRVQWTRICATKRFKVLSVFTSANYKTPKHSEADFLVSLAINGACVVKTFPHIACPSDAHLQPSLSSKAVLSPPAAPHWHTPQPSVDLGGWLLPRQNPAPSTPPVKAPWGRRIRLSLGGALPTPSFHPIPLALLSTSISFWHICPLNNPHSQAQNVSSEA